MRLPQYSHWVGYEEWLEMNTLRMMTDLAMGPFPWAPDTKWTTQPFGLSSSAFQCILTHSPIETKEEERWDSGAGLSRGHKI